MLVTILVILAGVDFKKRLASSVTEETLPRNAVVFTGQFHRIRSGLELLRQERLEPGVEAEVPRARAGEPAEEEDAEQREGRPARSPAGVRREDPGEEPTHRRRVPSAALERPQLIRERATITALWAE